MFKFIKYFILFSLFLSVQTIWSRTTYGQALCQEHPNVPCITVKSEDTWDSLWPDANMQDKAMRINRMNTYLSTGMTLVDPTHMSDQQINALLPFPGNIGSQDHKTILVSIKDLAWAAYDVDGKMLRWGPVSTGKAFCADIDKKCGTPTGIYTIYRKGGEGCVSSEFPLPNGGAPIPFCMHFKGGFAIHGSDLVPGYNDSHGCVRTFTEDAEWLNRSFIVVGSTQVIIKKEVAQPPFEKI